VGPGPRPTVGWVGAGMRGSSQMRGYVGAEVRVVRGFSTCPRGGKSIANVLIPNVYAKQIKDRFSIDGKTPAGRSFHTICMDLYRLARVSGDFA
jgi:hypothetical protein